jgi:hypothetical protein
MQQGVALTHILLRFFFYWNNMTEFTLSFVTFSPCLFATYCFYFYQWLYRPPAELCAMDAPYKKERGGNI